MVVESPRRRSRFARRPDAAGAIAVLRDVYAPELHNHRDVYVYLPPSYGLGAPDARYPVLYMHDGQNLFDPALSFSGAWRVDLAMQTAARLGYEAIVVGILEDGMAAGRFFLPDAKVSAFAILAMLTGVGSWWREGGRIAKRELIEMHTRLVMQCVGAPAEPPPAAPARPRSWSFGATSKKG